MVAVTAATWIEVGKVSLLDWLALTWSLGCASTPRAGGERGEHLVHVHVGAGARAGLEDVDRELVVVLAADDLVGGAADRLGHVLVDDAELGVDAAAAAFTRASARRARPRGVVPLIGKFSTARWVCARHSASSGTCDLAHAVVLGAGRCLVVAHAAEATRGRRRASTSPRARRAGRRTAGSDLAEDLVQRLLQLGGAWRPTRSPAPAGSTRRASRRNGTLVERRVGRRARGSPDRCPRRAAPGRRSTSSASATASAMSATTTFSALVGEQRRAVGDGAVAHPVDQRLLDLDHRAALDPRVGQHLAAW